MHRLAVMVVFLLAARAVAQNPSSSDPLAVSLAQKSIAALTGGIPIGDATLTGDAIRIVGPDKESGTVTLSVKGTEESRVDLNLSTGSESEVRNVSNGVSAGAWAKNSGVTPTPYAAHNCLTDAAWFFPALSSLSSLNPAIVFTYVGLEKRGGISVHHLQSYRYFTNVDAATASLVRPLSRMEFYLDSNSLLPVTMTFTVHPEADAGRSIPVEISFSNYQQINGAQIPLHIQKYLQGSLALDVTVSGVNLNSGISDTNFTIQ